jgi:Fe-S-cluster containining protein
MAETACNGCGCCCDPVVIPHSPTTLANGVSAQVAGPELVAWMREHLTPIKRSVGIRLAGAQGLGHQTDAIIGGVPVSLLSWFWSCDLYDPATRQCTDWEHRPDICRGYPWYDEPPDPTKRLPLECSYRTDIGQPVELRTKP